MDGHAGTCPLTQTQLIDLYFMEMRAKLIDIAAFLDRMERAVERNAEADFRMVALRQGLRELAEGRADRARTVQMIFSDPTLEPREHLDRKAAFGAFDHSRQEVR